MTYNVFSGTLNPTQSMNQCCVCACVCVWIALLWTAPELLREQKRLGYTYVPGTQPGDVYSFAIIVHEIAFRGGPFLVEDDYVHPLGLFFHLVV